MAALTEEQSMIRDQAKAWASDRAPVSAFRAVRDSGELNGFASATWQEMIDMGWTGILVPEAYGGSDLGYLTFGVVLEELGRQLTASPLLASALVGASAVNLGGNDAQKQRYLPGIVQGEEIFTLAVDEGPRHTPQNIALTAESNADGFVLNGQKKFVLEGLSATQLVVAAKTGGGISLLIVSADAKGISREAVRTMDSRGYADIQFDNVAVSSDNLLGTPDGGDALLHAILDRGRAGVAAEMLGSAAQAFDMTLEYLKTREQFGRVIGSFQALGHRAAGLFSTMELTRSCVEAALQGLDAGADTAKTQELCSLSKAKMGAFLHEMSNQLIQIHGGIGMTDEFDAGLYLKRARVIETLYGNSAFHRECYARCLGF